MKKLMSRIFALLQPVERRRARGVVLGTLVGSILDFASLAALMPLLYFLLEDGENRRAALLFGVAALVIVLLKWALGEQLRRNRSRFLIDLYKRFSLSLYLNYYSRGLLFIRSQGALRLGFEVNQICYAFSQSLLAPIMTMLGEGLLIALALIALVVYSPLMALVFCLSFLPFVLVYILVIIKRARLYGRREQEAKRNQHRIVTDTFSGYVELQVNGAFAQLQSTFEDDMNEIGSNRLKLETLMRLPLPLSELAVVLGLVLLTASGAGDVEIIIGLFAVAAFRLLPAVRAILSGWTVVQNASHCIDVLEEGLAEPVDKPNESGEVAVFNNEIAFENISYTYPDGEKVFDNFSARIRKGEYIGLKGHSGVGKSTLFNLLLGFLTPERGRVAIDGKNLAQCSRQMWLRRVGYVPQEVFIFSGSLAENIALGCADIDRKRVAKLVAQVSLGEWVEKLPYGVDTNLGEHGSRLSGGQRQRIGIARALYRKIDLLLLDEATSALDSATEREVSASLSKIRASYPMLTILMIAHRDSSLEQCDRIIKIESK